MKIDVVGSGCTWTRGLSTSFVINDEILFDVPLGSFKSLMHDYNLEKINYIIISHFHSDHFNDIHLVLDYIFNRYPNKKLTIIAPNGCFERICTLFRLIEVSYLEEYLKDLEFIVCENGKKFKLGQYDFKCFKMTHGKVDAYGFIIDHNNVKVGFTGDTAMCNNVHKILKKTKGCFIDCANVQPNNKHLSVGEVVELSHEYSDCKLFLVHLSIYSIEQLEKLNIQYPHQSEVINIE